MAVYLELSEQTKTLLSYISYGLIWVSWLLLLGGLSGVQASCHDLRVGNVVIPNVNASSLNCESAFSYMWWMLVFQFVWLILLGFMFRYATIAHWRPIIIAVQLLLAIKAMDFADQLCHILWEINTGQTETTRLGVAAAGQIMLFIFNMILLLCIAMTNIVPLLSTDKHGGGGDAGAHHHGHTGSGAGGGGGGAYAVGGREASRMGTPGTAGSSKLRPGEFTVSVPQQ